MEPIVVTGVGAVTPLGVGARTLHERWSAGVCGVVDGEAPCADFDPREFLSAKEVRRADRFTQLALAACQEALADAGWGSGADGANGGVGGHPYPPERIGCVLGTGIGGIGTLVDGQDTLRERGGQYVSPLSVPLMMSNAGAGALSMAHGLRGPSFAVSSACASGAHAIGSALRMLQTGEADAVVAGGSEAGLTPLARAAFSALDALSKVGISRPFDARRDGFVMGEGAAVLVLERADAARARGARVLGVDPRLRRQLRRPPPHRAPRRRRRAGRRHDRCARRRPRRRPSRSTTSTRTAPPRRSTIAPRRTPSSSRSASTPSASPSPPPSPPSGTCSAPPAPSRPSPRCSPCATASPRPPSA